MTRSETRRMLGTTTLGFGLLLSLLIAAPSCSNPEESLVSPCESELTCGQPCESAASCMTGQYCGAAKTCTAECISGDSRCGSGRSCNGSGRCVQGPGLDLDPNVGGSSSGAGGNSGDCPGADVDLGAQTPTVILLVDQSSSMNADFGISDRWQTLRTALMDEMGIVNTLQDQVRFGLSLYSSRNGAAPCPALTNVAPMLGNFAAINAAYPVPTESIIDDTPTGESITAAAQTLAGVQELGPKVIVLATDGEPDTCAIPDGDGDGARELTVQAAQDAFASGIFTFYISVGNDVSNEHATEVANVGQGYARNDPMQRFYRANDQAQLRAAFDTIIGGVRSCAFALDGMLTPGGEKRGTVTLNDVPLVLDDPNGWHLISPTTIEVTGTACETVKNDKMPKLRARFECGAVVPVKPPA